MKHSGYHSILSLRGLTFGASLLVAFFAPNARASEYAPGQAMVVKVVGAATYIDRDGQGTEVTAGLKFGAGVTIATSPGATVELDLGVNGQKLVIKSNSILKINQLDYVATGADTVISTQLEVRKGGITGSVRKLSAGSKYEVKSANGVAVIQGAVFAIYADGTAAVWQGTIVVVYVIPGIKSEPVTVSAGQAVAPPRKPGDVPVVLPGDRPNDFHQDDFPPRNVPPPLIFVSPTIGASHP